MKTTFLIASFLITAAILLGQDIKELHRKVEHGSPSERVNAAQDLCKIYTSENKDSLQHLGENLFYFGIDEHYFPAIETGKLILAEFYVQTGRSSDGIATAKALIGNIEERGDERQMSVVCKIISQGYRNEEDAASSFFWAQESVKYSSKSEDPETRLNGLLSLAEAYILKNKPNDGIQTFQRYIKEATPLKNHRGLSAAYGRLGDIYRQKGDLVNGEKYFQLSFKEAQAANMITPLGHAINNLAIIYFEKGDTTKARSYFQMGLKKRELANDVRAISESYYNMGDYQFYIGKPELAKGWYIRSYDYAKLHRLKNEQKDALYALATLYKEIGDYKSANMYLEQYITLEEQLIKQNLKNDEEIRSKQLDFMKKEAQAKSEGYLEEDTFWDKLKWEWIALLVFAFLSAYLTLRLVKSKQATS